ncbi:3'-5' exoribonuclease (plasmid) [Enterobacter hormaechei]|uniref:3'-5' exoribonuclease domain-containing protein n=1 Tax=Enterobacter hormaechei TaxID=158836 RepID=UPI002B4C0BCE|nr:3'-5' exoribonuclease [Enterobacter hormaechei]WRM07133.1 3'-5' exoribonuclease [Enterobacter hormaechei]
MSQLTLQERLRPAYAPQKLSRLRIMIDKESLSTKPNAAFISLSAVVMDFDAKSPQESLLNRFNMYVKIDSAFAYAESGAGHIDPQTIMWWFRQCDAARMDQANGQDEARDMRDVLVAFKNWVKDVANLYGVHHDRIEMWSCGPMQDQNWLEHAWRDTFPNRPVSANPPWPWWGVRCGRSFLSTFYKVKEGVANEGTLHVGIDDCCNQARKLFAIIRSIDLADPDLRNVVRREDGSFLDCDEFSPLNLVNVDTDEDAEE